MLIADTPYNVTLAAENISSQATKVRAIDIARMDVLGVGQVKLVLSGPPIASVSESAPRQTSTIASKDDSSRVSESGARKSIKEFRGVVFEVSSCELTELRIVLCRMVVTSKYQDRTLDLLGGGYTKVQDDTGKSYPTRMSFGENAEGGQRQSVLIAGTPYNVTLTAENISSRATKVRAIDIARMDLAGVGQVKLVLAHPPMIATQHAAGSRPAATNTVSTRPQPIAPQVRAKTAAPAVTASPVMSKPPGSTTAAWQTVGLWDYDATDGQHLAQGFVLRNKRGSGLGQMWKAHLELKDHNTLTPRQRTLWPVMMSVKLRKVCANYPGYPTYQVFVDMPGEADDGMYTVSFCKGGA
ncbi:MAG TPA: hypothetical protein ENI74_08505 [Gammaproteobacteria bacterium]|nr:hypothetical protein [Gammaproteobacteria bacterium]